MKTKWIKMLSAAMMLTLWCGTSTQAAEKKAIDIKEDVVKVAMGGSAVIDVDCSGVVGGGVGVTVVSADSQVAMAAITDNGNQTAKLSIVGVGMGSTTVAVYSYANPQVVDYITVQSGLTQNSSDIVTQMTGTGLVTVFHDRVVNYPYILTGSKEDMLQVTGLLMERESGRDKLKVTGNLLTLEDKVPGMNTFYANFYDASGMLINRQPVYSRDPYAGSALEIFWYVPEGCTSIVLE